MTGSAGLHLDRRELDGVAALMAAAGVEPSAPLVANLIAGGRSNLTFRLDDGRRSWVLRTPPRAGRTPSAHDVAREHRVTTALVATTIPVPAPVLLVEDEALLGGPFAVAEFVRGAAIRTQAQLAALTASDLGRVVTDLVAVLAALHRVDHLAAGLGSLGRPDGYAARQLRRWSGQWEHVGRSDLDALHAEVVRALDARLPTQSAVALVHGDYRIDNVLLAGTGVAAVVDWELATIGDPVADVAMMCAYRESCFDLVSGESSAWTSDRLPSVDELATAYVAAGGAPLVGWSQHLALAYFKIATIAAGIDHRHRAGASSDDVESAGQAVAPYLELARAALVASD